MTTTDQTIRPVIRRPTVEDLKAWARDHRDLAMTVAKAQAFASVERERVDAYERPIFDRYTFTDDMLAHHNEPGVAKRVLTDPKQLYLSEDEERVAAYYAECEVAHRAHGYQGEEGTCPALVAEDLQFRAEALLLDALAGFIGTDGFYTLELRAKALDMAMRCALGGAA